MPAAFENLPPLTIRQANAVGAMLAAHGTLFEISAFANMPPAEFLDCLASPAVQAHLANARRQARMRTETRITEAAHTAVEALERIAENPNAPHQGSLDLQWQIERRRAATTILRAHAPRRRASHAKARPSGEPSSPPAIQEIAALLAKLEAPLSTQPQATPVAHVFNESATLRPDSDHGPLEPAEASTNAPASSGEQSGAQSVGHPDTGDQLGCDSKTAPVKPMTVVGNLSTTSPGCERACREPGALISPEPRAASP